MAESQSNGTVIGNDTFVKGEMTVENSAKILGRFEGFIKSKGQVEIADKASCQADVEATVVQINGGMQGNITASDRVQLNATADVRGDILANKLIVADGARLEGHFKVGPEAVKKGAAPQGPPPVTTHGGPPLKDLKEAVEGKKK